MLRAAPPYEGIVPVDGGELWYERRGSGAPVVFTHGSPATADLWLEEVVRLAPAFETIRYDLRGSGRSASTSIRFSYHEDLLTLLDRLRVERAHLVGHSVGGAITLDFAVSHPERVASLVLVNSALEGFESPHPEYRALRARWTRPIVEAEEVGDREATVDAVLATWLAGPYRSLEEVDPLAIERARALVEAGLDGSRLGDLSAIGPEPPARGRLRRVHVPTLLVVGALDLPDLADTAEFIAREIRGSERSTAEGTAHFPMIEQPELFHDRVRRFLERHPIEGAGTTLRSPPS